MQRSKSVALSFLLGALLVGGALGFTAYPIFVGEEICGRSQRRMQQNIERELDLTPTQRAAFDSILDRRHREISALMSPIRPRLDSVRDRARQDMMKVLDDRQRQLFQQRLAERHAHDKHRKGEK